MKKSIILIFTGWSSAAPPTFDQRYEGGKGTPGPTLNSPGEIISLHEYIDTL